MHLEPDFEARDLTDSEIMSQLYLDIARKDKLIQEMKEMIQQLYIQLKASELKEYHVNN